MDYKTSGVNVEAGRAFVQRIKSCVEATHRAEVIGGMGGFGGLMRLPHGLNRPVLVAGTDGVGTKLELAQEHQAHFGVGIDLVAMCVNDVITSGAEPLFFLDYIATGSLSPDAMAEVVEGIAQGCRLSGCALLGGETAEMPGFYSSGRYDLAGFCVGVVEEDQIIDGSKMRAGDQIIAVASNGLHSNGFSLVRKILEVKSVAINSVFGTKNLPLLDALLQPTQLYGQLVKSLIQNKIPIHGLAHITGGGLPENLPRCVPKGLAPSIDIKSWERPELFSWLQETGDIPERDLWNTFNLGVGFCLVLPSEVVEKALLICQEQNMNSWLMGQVVNSQGTNDNQLIGLPIEGV